MVWNEVDDDANAATMRGSYQLSKLLVGTVTGIYVVIVGHVVAVVAHRFGDWHQPDAVHSKVGGALRVPVIDVVEMGDQTTQVPNTIAVRIGKRADKDLVTDAGV
jgi:hypothetical protein